ncbi:MAG TPA: hypothetical protein VNA21_13195 [Steroidobacteraceae bacterium]|nr:hypothetical protein [Steroidobacteraceae bacterium]
MSHVTRTDKFVGHIYSSISTSAHAGVPGRCVPSLTQEVGHGRR